MNFYLLVLYRGILTIFAQSAPARSPAESVVVKLAGVCCEAHRPDVVSEVNRAAELHQCNVVVIQCVVVVGMDNDL